ncbi:MAG: UvrD-helicase domain-containing protein [Pirellulaceae bacterium]
MFDETPTSFLDGLNPAQRQAVEHIHGPLLILAGPGSGKTRVITHRIAHMIQSGVDSRNIVALTFTNKAADEMRNRLEAMIPGHQAWTGTFHRFCSRLLRVYAPQVGLSENFTIYDTGDSRKLIKDAVGEAELDLRHHSMSNIAEEISKLKNAGIQPDQFEPRPGNYLQRIVASIYPQYQRLLQMANGVDFDDLLLLVGQLLTENEDLRASLDDRYSHMMVDEYQDTNTAQYRLILMLNQRAPNIAVTGDPDQSIYGWRGATLSNILEFEKDFQNVRVVRLEQNYRSTKSILSVADTLIANNLRRKAKSLHTDNDRGEPVTLISCRNPEEEARQIAETIAHAVRIEGRRPSEFAIFYRTNSLSRSLEHSLRAHGIPYQVVQGLEFYQRREIKDVLAYAHLINNPSDSIAFQRIVNVPSRTIGDKTIEKLRRYAIDNGHTMLEAARRAGLVNTIAKSTATKISKFVALYDQICEHREKPVAELFQKIVDLSGYREWLIDDGTEESHDRANNVDELIVAAAEFDQQHPDDGGLESFLEQAALVNDTDAWESTSDFVTLLTIHSSKGLEFPCVFIVGLEDGILPHERSSTNDEEIEEERRLLFVGITRAMERLQISRCENRYRKGGYWPCIASRFLMELPRDEMNVIEPRSINDFGDDDEPWAEHLDPWMNEGVPEIDVNDDDSTQVYESAVPFQVDSSKREADISPATDMPALITASELAKKLDSEPRNKLHPDVFSDGMDVEHPVYGVGTIVGLSGSGIKKTATVDFREYGKRRFRLSHSPLTPVQH